MISALDIFEREGIAALPLEPSVLARRAGIPLVTYESLSSRKAGADLIRRVGSSDGFTFRAGGQTHVAYNSEVESLERQRWTLTHELCHIWLGHLDETASDRAALAVRHSPEERAANDLCSRLLCPLPVLHLCAVESAAALAALCGVSLEAAAYRMRELSDARRAGRLLRSEEDRRMAALFLPFISDAVTAALARRAARRHSLT